MSGRNFIVMGDSHSHGGRVISGAETTRIQGKSVARLGDKAVCSLHGGTSIASVSSGVFIDGKEAALEGDLLACGGRLIASQNLVGR